MRLMVCADGGPAAAGVMDTLASSGHSVRSALEVLLTHPALKPEIALTDVVVPDGGDDDIWWLRHAVHILMECDGIATVGGQRSKREATLCLIAELVKLPVQDWASW